MASSKVMTNQDLPRQSSSSLSAPPPMDQTFAGSMNVDDLINSIYAPDDAAHHTITTASGAGAARTAEEVWKEIVEGKQDCGGDVAAGPVLTLEDFLTKAGAVDEDDVAVHRPQDHQVHVAQYPPAADIPPMMNVVNPAAQYPVMSYAVEASTGIVGPTMINGRGKRRVSVDEAPVDRATQQKQRRMIKNRESAARSRERKQAYTVELEAMVMQLEEENARLVREEAERSKMRFNKLIKNLVPAGEKPRPARALRRVHSM